MNEIHAEPVAHVLEKNCSYVFWKIRKNIFFPEHGRLVLHAKACNSLLLEKLQSLTDVLFMDGAIVLAKIL